MEIDTGSAVSIMSDSLFSSVFQNAKLQKTKTKLCNYSGEQLPVQLQISYIVDYQLQRTNLHSTNNCVNRRRSNTSRPRLDAANPPRLALKFSRSML